MRLIKIIIFFFLIIEVRSQANENIFNRLEFYEIIRQGDINSIENQLKEISQLKSEELDAYRGALLMRKAGLLRIIKNKILTFAQGHELLESMIKEDINNIEFRFLRLMIQEHAPRILNYHSNLMEDKELIQKSFSKAPLWLQKILKDYSKDSKQLGELTSDKYK